MRFHELKYFDDSKELLTAKNNVIEKAFDASRLYNVKPASVTIPFTSSDDAPTVVWGEHGTVTFTHALNCYPIVQVYNAEGVLVYPEVAILSGTSFMLNFDADNSIGENETWKCTVTYGAEYGASGNPNTDVASLLQRLNEIKNAVIEITRFEVGHATAYGVLVNGDQLSFTWTDPTDYITDGGVRAAEWGKTRLIMKTGGFPENENDGTVLVDNVVRDQYRETPFVWNAGVLSNYYFALFTCTTDGVWNTADSAPRFTTDLLAWATIGMLIRSNSILAYPNMSVGAKIPLQVSTAFPLLRYKLGCVNYTAHQPTCADWHYDHNKRYNIVLIPDYLPCLGESQNALMLPFDNPESQYAQTWDETFLTGKIYYKYDGENYVQLVEGEDYEASANIQAFSQSEGYSVYTKNHNYRKNYGYGNWKCSNIRQFLNTSGSKGQWFQKQNEYDANGINYAGFMAGLDPAFLALVQPVYNKTARNTVSALSGGDGGGYDITLDTFWLPSMKEIFNTNINGIAEGKQFDYFSTVATTANDMIQRDEGLTARNVWTRSPYVNNCGSVYALNSSGSSNNYYANNSYAVFATVCLAG